MDILNDMHELKRWMEYSGQPWFCIFNKTRYRLRREYYLSVEEANDRAVELTKQLRNKIQSGILVYGVYGNSTSCFVSAPYKLNKYRKWDILDCSPYILMNCASNADYHLSRDLVETFMSIGYKANNDWARKYIRQAKKEYAINIDITHRIR